MPTDNIILASLLEHIEQGAALFDRSKNIVFWNSKYETIFDYPSGFLKVGLSNYEITKHLADRGIFGQGDAKNITLKRLDLLWGGKISNAEITDANGVPYDARFLLIEGGGLAVTYTDITDRKATETALKLSEQPFKDFASVTSDWFWETDQEHRFTYMSMADPNLHLSMGQPEEQYGKTRQELSSNTDTDYWKKHLSDLKRQRPFRDFQYERKAGGKTYYMSISGHPIYDGSGSFLGYRGTGRYAVKDYWGTYC